MRCAMLQLSSGPDPEVNLIRTEALMRRAVAEGAEWVLTPEATNCLSVSREHQAEVLRVEDEDRSLACLREWAAELGVWLSIGSLALKREGQERFANRGFMITPLGEIAARYDKLHMFDVQVSETERYEESRGYAPGERAVVAEACAPVGMAICYDLRFPQLFRQLAQAGAQVLIVPSAFSPTTGAAHWEPLLRARAIECGAYVLAAAQCGEHDRQGTRVRSSYGHSLAVGPWGEVLADGGEEPGVVMVDIDLDEVAKARARMPSLTHDRAFEGP